MTGAARDILKVITDTLLVKLGDIDGIEVSTSVNPLVQVTPQIAGPAIVIIVTSASPILGERLGHMEFLNPFDIIDEQLLTNVAMNTRMDLGRRRAAALGSMQS